MGTEGAKLLGKSGVQHTFDMLGRRDDGITSYTVAVSLAAGGDSGNGCVCIRRWLDADDANSVAGGG